MTFVSLVSVVLFFYLFRGYFLSFSIILRHVSHLSHMGVLSWRATGQGKLMLTFDGGPVEKVVRDQAADAAPELDDIHAEIPDSRILKNENHLSLFNLLYIIFNFKDSGKRDKRQRFRIKGGLIKREGNSQI